MTDNLRGDTICNGIKGKGCGEVVQVMIGFPEETQPTYVIVNFPV